MKRLLPRLDVQRVVGLLEEHGFVCDCRKGSQAVYRHSDGRRTSVSFHGHRTIGVGLLRQIFKDAGIDPHEIGE